MTLGIFKKKKKKKKKKHVLLHAKCIFSDVEYNYKV